MTRERRTYTDRSSAPIRARPGAIDVSQDPTPGFYRYRLRAGAVKGVVRIWYGPPNDPVTGEPLDRSWRHQAEFNGKPIELEDVWPKCGGEPVTEAEYRRAIARQDWAREAAPTSAYADPKRKADLLSEPLPSFRSRDPQ